jgi:hypothetical protein
MGRPTIFYILENRDLGTWWVGKVTVTLDDGWSPYRSVTQDELYNKLQEKYEHFPNAYLTLSPLNKGWVACYGVERWLSNLEYKINKDPEKYRELKELLMAGWDGVGEVSTLSVLHVFSENQPIDEIFKKLVKSREGLTRCLNTHTGKTYCEKYSEKTKDTGFLYNRARNEVLRNMKKTGKIPKPSTLKKYDIDIISASVSQT